MRDEFKLKQLEVEGPVTVLEASGRLDGPAAEILRRSCNDLRAGGTMHLALDLAQVSFVSSSGVGALLALTEEFGRVGCNLYLAPVSTAVTSVIRLLNLEQFLAIYESREAAISVIR